MAAVFVLIAFSGFTPTYWARLANGTSHVTPIVHIHGILMFSWTLFYFIQTAWIAAGRTATHRAWGLAGISPFSVLVCSIIVTKVVTLRLDDAAGFGDAGRRFSLVALGGLPLIIGQFVAAIANVRRPEIHKRLMFVLMSGLMIPAIARVFLTLFARPVPRRAVRRPLSWRCHRVWWLSSWRRTASLAGHGTTWALQEARLAVPRCVQAPPISMAMIKDSLRPWPA